MEHETTIQMTWDPKKFKKLEGNRPVTEIRVQKIVKSINAVGYVMNPIIVNENLEVIDGQGRLEALERLGLPIYYIVVPGLGHKECIAMNVNQTNWGMVDYIESYAALGNESYMYLLDAWETYKGKFVLSVILNALNHYVDSAQSVIKNGTYKCTAEQYTGGMETLKWLMQFKPVIDRLDGNLKYYYIGLAFCHCAPEVDDERLVEKINALQANLIPVSTTKQALEQIEAVYNHRARTKVYIKTNYQKRLDENLSWYSKRWTKE